jgi:hypothetical protein
MAEQCTHSPRNGLPCVLPYTWEAHRPGHRTDPDVGRVQESHWPTTPAENAAMMVRVKLDG